MVTLTFVPGSDWTRFVDGSIEFTTRHKKIFFKGETVPWMVRGSVRVYQPPVLQVATFAPFISFSQSLIEPDSDSRPFNMLRGRITARPGASRRLVASKAGTNSFQLPLGTIVVRRESAQYGTLAEFAFWPDTGMFDPVTAYFTNIVDTSDAGGPGTPWKRISAVAVPPKDARYVGVGVQLEVSTGDLVGLRPHYVKYAQLEKVAVGGDVSNYAAPREVRTTIHPERLNWDENPGFAVNTTRWTGLTRTASVDSPTGYVGRASTTAVNGATVTFTHTIPIVYADTEYTFTALLWSSQPVGFSLSFSGVTELERRVPVDLGPLPQRVWIRFRTDAAATAPVATGVFRSRGVVANCDVTAAMLEKEGQFDADYFDGGTYGTDSIWENGATAGQARSYYYKNRLERLAALKRLLKENVPYGLPVAEPRMGVLPADIAPPGTSNLVYGSGVYGGGIYGGA